MRLLLKSFSQDVDLANPDDIRYFLIFDAGGHEVKLPVQKDTTEALINLIYSEQNDDKGPQDEEREQANFSPPVKHSEIEDTDLEGAEVFGDNHQSQEDGPSSEEEINSL